MDRSTLGGCSILVLEEQPFVARCLRILLEGAGAKVHNATNTDDALYHLDRTGLFDRTGLSAAVLSCSETTKGRRRLVQRLVRLNLPMVFCKDVDQRDTWPGIPALIKPISGLQLVEILCGLIIADANKTAARVAPGPIGGNANVETGESHIRFAETPS